jgi:hypothetical protein
VSPAVRVAIVATFAAAFAVLLYPVYLALRAGGNKVFEPHPFDFALIAVAAFAIALGSQIVPWRAATNVAVLALLAAAGLLFGSLAILSIGLVVLPVALVVLVVLARAVARGQLAVARPAALGGAVVGYGLVLLYLAVSIPATVECFANGGGSTSSLRYDRSGGITTTSSSGSTTQGVQTGRIESPTSVATYRCEQGRVVEFRRESR